MFAAAVAATSKKWFTQVEERATLRAAFASTPTTQNAPHAKSLDTVDSLWNISKA